MHSYQLFTDNTLPQLLDHAINVTSGTVLFASFKVFDYVARSRLIKCHFHEALPSFQATCLSAPVTPVAHLHIALHRTEISWPQKLPDLNIGPCFFLPFNFPVNFITKFNFPKFLDASSQKTIDYSIKKSNSLQNPSLFYSNDQPLFNVHIADKYRL